MSGAIFLSAHANPMVWCNSSAHHAACGLSTHGVFLLLVLMLWALACAALRP